MDLPPMAKDSATSPTHHRQFHPFRSIAARRFTKRNRETFHSGHLAMTTGVYLNQQYAKWLKKNDVIKKKKRKHMINIYIYVCVYVSGK